MVIDRLEELSQKIYKAGMEKEAFKIVDQADILSNKIQDMPKLKIKEWPQI